MPLGKQRTACKDRGKDRGHGVELLDFFSELTCRRHHHSRKAKAFHSRSRQLPNPAPERGSWRIEIDRAKNDREGRAIDRTIWRSQLYKETAANDLKSDAGEEILDVLCLVLCCCAFYSDILIVACEPRFH